MALPVRFRTALHSGGTTGEPVDTYHLSRRWAEYQDWLKAPGNVNKSFDDYIQILVSDKDVFLDAFGDPL